MNPIVVPLADPGVDVALVGGKGAALARLTAAGLPVPAGFQITTEAYRAFVTGNGLQEPILAALSEDPEQAAQRISRLFEDAPIPPLFPRAAAVVTDIGAPLSHAAIVARELGIPAVVGTGNATTRIHTGTVVVAKW